MIEYPTINVPFIQFCMYLYFVLFSMRLLNYNEFIMSDEAPAGYDF